MSQQETKRNLPNNHHQTWAAKDGWSEGGGSFCLPRCRLAVQVTYHFSSLYFLGKMALVKLIPLYHHHWDGGEETVALSIYKPSYAHLREEDRQPLDVAAGNQEKSAKQPPPDLGCQRRMERGRGSFCLPRCKSAVQMTYHFSSTYFHGKMAFVKLIDSVYYLC